MLISWIKIITEPFKKLLFKLGVRFNFRDSEHSDKGVSESVNTPDETHGVYDLKVERKLVDFQKCDDLKDLFVWQINVKNSRNFAQRVLLEEKQPGEWKILKSSHRYERDDARTVLFDVTALPSEKSGDTIITYEVEVLH